MNELILYKIIEAILKASTVIEGRFVVAEGYGNDLNANNFSDIVLDTLGNYKPEQRKYPVSVLMPPVEIIDKYEKGWSRFKLDQFFLCTSGQTGMQDFKDLNPLTNIAEHSIKYDWKDMAICAKNFRKLFNKITREKGYQLYVNSATDAKDYIRRVSNMGNDKLNGVVITYELNIAIPCEFEDYTDQAIAAIVMPNIVDPHPPHKH